MSAQDPDTKREDTADRQWEQPFSEGFVFLFHLLIFLIFAHQIMNIHLAETSLAPQQCQQITARITAHRHDQTVTVKFQMWSFFQLYHTVQHHHQYLLQQHPKSHSQHKCSGSKKNIFSHIKSGYLLFLHPDQQINPELPASFFQHEAYHIIDQPRHDQHDKKGRDPDHRSHHPGKFIHFLDVSGKNNAVKCKHQRHDKGHRQHIDQIISGGASDISKGKFTEHLSVHLPSGQAHPKSCSETSGDLRCLLPVHGRSFRLSETESVRNSSQKMHRALPSGS